MKRLNAFVFFNLAMIIYLSPAVVSAAETEGRQMTVEPQAVWGSVSSHFRLASVDQPLSDRLQREVLDALEKWHRRFLILFETEPEPPIAVLFYPAHLFHSQTGAPSWADGVYEQVGLIRIAAGGVSRLEPALERVLSHELAHAFITVRSAGRAPRWLQEGLAQLLAGSPSAGNFRTTATTPENLNYAGSLVYTRALEARFGTASLIDVLEELRTGSTVSRAFKTVTGTKSDALYTSWHTGARRAVGGRRQASAP